MGMRRIYAALCTVDGQVLIHAAERGGLQLAQASAKLNRHRTMSTVNYGMVFNPANFVAAGENPFLFSFKRGRFIRTAVQLDLVDQTWESVPSQLARGNAEVKELISIMRCYNFSGFMTLGGGAAYPGNLEEAVGNFTHLLDNM